MFHHRLRYGFALAQVFSIALALLVISSSALATTDPPVRVRQLGDPNVLPVEGQIYRGSFELTSSMEGVVEAFVLSSGRDSQTQLSHWETISITLPGGGEAMTLQGHEPVEVAFDVMCNDLTQPLTLDFQFEGFSIRRSFPMIPHMDTSVVPLDPAKALVLDHFPSGPSDFSKPGISKGAAEELARSRAMKGDVAGKKYSIRVKGRFFYQRTDGIYIGVDGATVRVYDEDWDWDQLLAVQVTDVNGNFDFTFSYTDSEAPDIYLEIEAGNAKVEVEHGYVGEPNYYWETPVVDDYSGTFINYGTFAASSARPAAHILTNITRAWRWLDWEGYGGIPVVCVQWPDSDSGAHYVDYWEEIHVATDRQWNDRTHWHEYGHHWVNIYADDDGSDYCNNICDDPDDCGHCQWCPEAEVDSWREGWPDWFGDVVGRSIKPNYGIDPYKAYNFETIGTCGDLGDMYGAQNRTEGIFAALLRDIEDGVNMVNDDDGYSPSWNDPLSLGPGPVLWVSNNWEPLTPLQFIFAFKNTYPELIEDFWEVCMNNGWDIDGAKPGVATNLISQSHPTPTPSPNSKIWLNWDHAPDDAAGIFAYGISVTPNIPIMPPAAIDTYTPSYISPNLDPGTYYVNVRALDRSGNWSDAYATYGPVNIREPLPADFSVQTVPAGWTYPLSPRAINNSTSTSVPAPSVLSGDHVKDTWLNLAIHNHGELPNPAGQEWITNVYVDGEPIQTYVAGIAGIISPGSYQALINQGPFPIRGGRHMLSVITDEPADHAEENEDDNAYNVQFSWSGAVTPQYLDIPRTAPPDPFGGLFDPAGPFYSYNVDGLTIADIGQRFKVLSIRALNDADDYDCRLHESTSSPIGGFSFWNALGLGAWSTRGPGCLDAVIVNQPNTSSSSHSWDIGVINENGGTGDYVARYRRSTSMFYGTSMNVNFEEDQYLAAGDFNVTAANVGWLSIAIDVDPSQGPLHAILLDESFSTGDLLDFDDYEVTDANGKLILEHHAQVVGNYGLVLWRDPKDVPVAKQGPTPPFDVTLEIQASPADLTPYPPVTWYGPIVPRPAPDGTASTVPAPSQLFGDSPSTYLNLSWANIGPNEASDVLIHARLDGKQVSEVTSALLGANRSASINDPQPIVVRGGRHTLTMQVDPVDTVPEGDELNNAAGAQWVWEPITLSLGVPVNRAGPPAPTAGWEDLIGSPDVAYLNCDGVRAPKPPTTPLWQAVAVMPKASSDVDVRVHKVKPGTQGGFVAVQASSAWSPGQSDFVLMNFNALTTKEHDIGVIRSAGTDNYTAELVESSFLGTNPQGEYGPFQIPAGHILNLHEMQLSAGQLTINVQGVAGDPVDWGMALHPAGLPYVGKSDAVINGLSWLEPAGQNEWVTLTVPESGRYCLSVWKVGAADLDVNGAYKTTFWTGATDTPPTSVKPQRTALASVHPNPFNPQTTIAFDLNVSAHVRLEIYNSRGEHVRTLLNETRSSGRHELTWNGRDLAGRAAASGVYFAQLSAGGVRDRRKMVLLK